MEIDNLMFFPLGKFLKINIVKALKYSRPDYGFITEVDGIEIKVLFWDEEGFYKGTVNFEKDGKAVAPLDEFFTKEAMQLLQKYRNPKHYAFGIQNKKLSLKSAPNKILGCIYFIYSM